MSNEKKNSDSPEEIEELDPSDSKGEESSEKEATSASEQAEVDVESLIKERDELQDKALRAKADFLNYQKRMRREIDEVRQYAIQDFAKSLLDVTDNFYRALDSVKDSQDFDGLKDGVVMTRDQLLEALKKHGVEAVDAEGQPFDPNRHEAVMQEERDDLEPGTVIEELVRGYAIGDRLLRPSVVRVSKAVTKPSAEKGSDKDEPSSDQ